MTFSRHVGIYNKYKFVIDYASINSEPAATSIGYNMDGEVQLHKPVPLRGGFAELQKKGLRIKDYHTTEKE